MIAGVLLEQFVAEPQDLRLVGDVAGMAGDRDAGRGGRPRRGRGHRDGVGVQVARRDRAALRRQLADKLAADARAAAGHHRELAGERVHGHDRLLAVPLLVNAPGRLQLDDPPGRVVHLLDGQADPVPRSAEPSAAGRGGRLVVLA